MVADSHVGRASGGIRGGAVTAFLAVTIREWFWLVDVFLAAGLSAAAERQLLHRRGPSHTHRAD